jgi:hypothetical protein
VTFVTRGANVTPHVNHRVSTEAKSMTAAQTSVVHRTQARPRRRVTV